MDLDSLTTTRVAHGHIASMPIDHVRSERLGKVWVTPETKAMLHYIGEQYGIGASGIAALLIEELRHQGQLQQVWKAHRNRRRRIGYHRKKAALTSAQGKVT